LAVVELDISGPRIELHGIRALRVGPAGTRVELPTFREVAGISPPAIVLPEEVRDPNVDAVLDALLRARACQTTLTVPAAE
jgi:hypothetical protein